LQVRKLTNKKKIQIYISLILDFGISRFVKAGGAANTICGTPLYMAPEVAFGHQYTAKVDLWSIGIILYELSNGKPLLSVHNMNDVVLKFKRNNQFPFRYGSGVFRLGWA
jgi:serine/threonine-protein kinase ULK2